MCLTGCVFIAGSPHCEYPLARGGPWSFRLRLRRLSGEWHPSPISRRFRWYRDLALIQAQYGVSSSERRGGERIPSQREGGQMCSGASGPGVTGHRPSQSLRGHSQTASAGEVAPHCGLVPPNWRYSVNDGASREMCSLTYVSVDDATKLVLEAGHGRGAILAKLDVQSAYRNVLVHPAADDRPLLGMEWNGELGVCGCSTAVWAAVGTKDF